MKDVVNGFEKSGGLPGGKTAPNPQAMIYVSGLPGDAEDVDLFRLFNPFGATVPNGVTVMTNDDGSCKGFGFVDFQDPSSAEAAIAAFNGTIMPDGGNLVVKLKQEGKQKQKKQWGKADNGG